MNYTGMWDHLLGRHLDPSKYPGVFVGPDCAVFPIWDMSGRMVGYQDYRPGKPKVSAGNKQEQKYYTFVSRYGGSTPALAVWGLETVQSNKAIFLCEGIFDACRLHSIGLSAIAVLSRDPKHLISWLRCLSQPTISVCQGDKPGKDLAKYGDTAIFLPEGEDVGSLPGEVFKTVFDKYIDPGVPGLVHYA